MSVPDRRDIVTARAPSRNLCPCLPPLPRLTPKSQFGRLFVLRNRALAAS